MGVGEEKQQNLEAQALGENVYLMFPGENVYWLVWLVGTVDQKKKKNPKECCLLF